MSRKREYQQCNCGCTTNQRGSADDDLMILPDSTCELTLNAAATRPVYVGDCLELPSTMEMVANEEQDRRTRRKKLKRQADENGPDDDLFGLGVEDDEDDEDDEDLRNALPQRDDGGRFSDYEDEDEDEEDSGRDKENRRRLQVNSRHPATYIGSDPLILD